MNTIWKADEVDYILGSKSINQWVAKGIQLDSRKVTKGDLFLAMPGTKYDGHFFLSEAFSKGAVAAVVSKFHKDDKKLDNLLKVESVPKALQNLAKEARKRTSAKIIAVTGSVGKTGTKDMLQLALMSLGYSHASQKSFNNHVGVPLTLSNMSPLAKTAVIEMGMNQTGEISEHTLIVRPHIAIITAVEEAHIENLKTLEEVAKAKAEIFQGVSEEGAAIISRDASTYDILIRSAQSKGIKNIISFGEHEESDIRLLDYKEEINNSHIIAKFNNEIYNWDLKCLGKHWALNSLSVIGVAAALKTNVKKLLYKLKNFSTPLKRGVVMKIKLPLGLIIVIDDTYNANPASMRAAFANLNLRKTEGRKILILGDMAELGSKSSFLHSQLAKDLHKTKIDLVFTAGEQMIHLFDALDPKLRGIHAKESKSLSSKILRYLKPKDTLLVKGSRSSKMEVVIDELLSNKSNLL